MKRPVPDGFMTSPPHSVSIPRIAVAVACASCPFLCVHRFCGVNAFIVRSLTSCVAFSLGSP